MGFFLLWPVLVAGVHGPLLDRVVAVVEGDPITQSELVMEFRLALAMRAGEAVAMNEDSRDLVVRFLRDYLITQLLLADQARRYGAEDPSELAIDQSIQGLHSKFPTQDSYEDFLRKFGIGEARVRDIFRRDLRNEMFLAKQFGAETKSSDVRAKRLEHWLAQIRSSASILMMGRGGVLEPLTRMSGP